MIDFTGFGKIARYSREIVVTEKIDGTNSQIYIDQESDSDPFCIYQMDGFRLFAGSRKRWITPEDDNFCFARWAKENACELVQVLGPGRHFGEWWGSGIQRGYGLKEKRFSLFNTGRWNECNIPKCCNVVPILYEGIFDKFHAETIIESLRCGGSIAAPGFMNPEGIIIYHSAGNVYFKKTLKNDDVPKSLKGE